MLYDILPPLLLFMSFGGIIVVVSRVGLRMRHVQFSEDIQAEVDSKKPIHEATLLRPKEAGVTLVKNRMAHAGKNVASGIMGIITSSGGAVSALRRRRQEAREKKAVQPPVTTPTVQMPEVGLQDRISELALKGKEGLSSLRKGIANRMPDMQTLKERLPRAKEEDIAAPTSSPVIRLVRHSGFEDSVAEEPQEAPKGGLISHMRRRNKEHTALDQAEEAIVKEEFERAEDILIPYIMKHSSDTQAYMLLGKSAIGKGAWDEAMEIFQQVIKLDKNLVDAYADLGHAALNAGKFTLAIQSLQHARDMDESNIRIREELLFIARRMDNKVVEKGVLEELQELKEKV